MSVMKRSVVEVDSKGKCAVAWLYNQSVRGKQVREERDVHGVLKKCRRSIDYDGELLGRMGEHVQPRFPEHSNVHVRVRVQEVHIHLYVVKKGCKVRVNCTIRNENFPTHQSL